MTRLRVALLGSVECRSPAGEPLVFPTRKARALVAYLASSGRRQTRERLAGLLWGEQAQDEARVNLRKTLSRIRPLLPGDCLVTRGDGVLLRQDALDLDTATFERLVAGRSPDTLERAVALYRGPFLEDLTDCGEAFEEWLMSERRRLEEILHRALHRLLDHYVVTGGIDRAILVALRLLALDPLQEGVHRSLIRLYMFQDRLGSALDQYRSCRELLERELGVEPEAETEMLRSELLKRLPPETEEGPPSRETDEVPGRNELARVVLDDRARRHAELRGRPSIAVLCLAGADEAYRHLAEGMVIDIATELGRFREIDVIAPASALAYRDSTLSPEGVGAELGTAYVLDAQLRFLGERFRLNVRLLATETRRQVWAERYDCDRAETFDVQDELVRRIVGTLVGRIEDDRLECGRRKPPDQWEAYDLWLRGWSILRRSDIAAIGEARRLFRQALAKESRYASPYMGLALAHLNEWACFSWNHWVFPRQEVLDLAQKAVELDERDHRAHIVLGMTQIYGGDYDAARSQVTTALELNPNDADVLAHGSWALAILGRHDEAVEWGRRALRLAPHRPEWYSTFVGVALFAARRHEEAIETMATAPEALCNTPAFLAASYAHLERPDLGERYRETVYRHYRRHEARGEFPRGMSCVEWLVAMDPFCEPSDAEHYRSGLQSAGFE